MAAHTSGALGRIAQARQALGLTFKNFSPRKHARVRTWAGDHDIEPVLLPAYGSWLTWVEAEFAAVRQFALNGTDHRRHDQQNAAVGRLRPPVQHPRRAENEPRLTDPRLDPTPGPARPG